MAMTTACLKERHDAAPVHSIKEMQTLKDLFPEQIRFWILEYASSPQAAVCIYDTGRVAHAQYIATTTLGRELDLLTPLIDYLINEMGGNTSTGDCCVIKPHSVQQELHTTAISLISPNTALS